MPDTIQTYADLPFPACTAVTDQQLAPDLVSAVLGEGEICAVSIVYGRPPISDEVDNADTGSGLIVWSFNAGIPECTSLWARRHAALGFVHPLAVRGESIGSAAVALDGLARTSGEDCEVLLDEVARPARRFQVTEWGFLLSFDNAMCNVAVACFDQAIVPRFRTGDPALESLSIPLE